MQTLKELTAEYDAWLDANGLPGMSADELAFEVAAVANNEGSNIITPGTVCTIEQYDWLIKFGHRWTESQKLEDEARRWQHAEFILRPEVRVGLAVAVHRIAQELKMAAAESFAEAKAYSAKQDARAMDHDAAALEAIAKHPQALEHIFRAIRAQGLTI